MSALKKTLDAILDRAEAAALALDGAGLVEAVSALSEHEEDLRTLDAEEPVRRHIERRLFRLRGLCGGLGDVLGETLGIEEKYGATGEKVEAPARPATRGYA